MEDFVLCQNVLEHVHDNDRAVQVIASCLSRGGRLGILVPAGPRLFGSLDRRNGHERRSTRSTLRDVLERADLSVTDLYSIKALGIPGWAVKNLTGAGSLGTRSLAVTSLFQNLPLRQNGFAIEAEITARLLRSGARIYEIPITYRARRREEEKKLTPVDGLKVMATLARCRIR